MARANTTNWDGLNNRNIAVLQTRSPQSMCWPGHTGPSKGSRGDSFLTLLSSPCCALVCRCIASGSALFPLGLYVLSFFFLIRTPVLLHLVSTLMLCDLTLTNYADRGPISKLSHILSVRVNGNSGWMPWKSGCHRR